MIYSEHDESFYALVNPETGCYFAGYDSDKIEVDEVERAAKFKSLENAQQIRDVLKEEGEDDEIDYENIDYVIKRVELKIRVFNT